MIALREAAAILVLKPRAIGDVLLMTPLLRAIRARYPKGRIVVATERGPAEVLQGSLHVDEILPWPSDAAGTLRFARALRARKFDVVLDAFGNPRTALVSWLSRCPVRIGYDVRVRRLAYTHVVRRLPAGNYNARVQLELLRPLGIPETGDRPQLFLSAEEMKWAASALSAMRIGEKVRPVLLNPGGTWVTKRWWAGRFGSLARRLADTTSGPVLVLWGPGEESTAQAVVASAADPRVRSIPPCSLRQMAALIARARLLVTNDGAAKHIAVALGVRSLALHGPTDFRAWHPEGGLHQVLVGEVPCGPCERTTCAHRSCMVKLSVPDVARAAEAMLPRG